MRNDCAPFVFLGGELEAMFVCLGGGDADLLLLEVPVGVEQDAVRRAVAPRLLLLPSDNHGQAPVPNGDFVAIIVVRGRMQKCVPTSRGVFPVLEKRRKYTKKILNSSCQLVKKKMPKPNFLISCTPLFRWHVLCGTGT